MVFVIPIVVCSLNLVRLSKKCMFDLDIQILKPLWMDDIYTHIAKKQTEETAIRFADFMSSTEEKQGSLQKVKSMVKNEKSRLSLLDSLLNVELSVFFLFRSVCVFETVLILFF